MRERFIPAIVMLLAGAITSIINIVNNVDKLVATKRLLLVLIIFYMVGLIAKAIIKRALTKASKKSEEDELKEEIDEEKLPDEK
jgi:F0F1-type ATP synthase assembly protein I